MKNIPSLRAVLILSVSLCFGAAKAQQMETDSAEQVRLAVRTEKSRIERQIKRANLLLRAQELNIPLHKLQGEAMLTLRSITPTGEPLYDALDNLISLQTSAADSVKANGGLGLSLTGAGQTLGIWEAFEVGTGAAVRTTHQEFGGRATQIDAGTISRHATHVAGTMIAAGVDANAEGFSSGADLRCFDITDDLDEMEDEAINTPPVRVSNHSYGTRSGWTWNNTTMMWDWDGGGGAVTQDWKFGAYNDDAQDWDEVAFNNPFLTIFKSAGNDRGDGPGVSPAAEVDGGADGFDCIPTYGTAKNIVTVGAIDDIPGGYTGPASIVQNNTNFSGWGPTDDGRIKPDIVANGDNLRSAHRTADDAYVSLSGTSMASPSASGGAGLLLEHWQNIVGGTPRSATLKGLMIHQADEAGAANGPDYSTGWGLSNIGDAAQLITIEGYFGCQQFVESSLGNSGVFTYDIFSSGTQPLKVTLTWNDPESGTTNNGTINPAGANYLVNNLQLSLVQGGTTFFPWVLDPANPGNAATTGVNNRDNVEQVFLISPSAGQYTVRVQAPATVSDGPQHFTLWFSGNDATVNNATYNSLTINGGHTYAVRQDLTFGPDFVVTNTGDVKGYAGHSVKLVPGFHAQNGSRFLARILPGGGCGQFSGELKADNYPGSKPENVDLATERQTVVGKSFDIAELPNLHVFPNPFDGSFSVQFEIPAQALVTLTLSDAFGRQIQQPIVQKPFEAGEHLFQMNDLQLPPGIYYLELKTPSARWVQKLVKVGQ